MVSMKPFFIIITFVLLLIGSYWLFWETPFLLRHYHNQGEPMPTIFIIAPLSAFLYGLSGQFLWLTKKHNLKNVGVYFAVGIITIIVITIIGRTIGNTWLMRI
jgi:hypothetical protein